MFSSSFQRSLPPRATHHNSSVPISVTRLSSVTGMLTLSFARHRQRHFQRAQLFEVVAPVVDQRARRVALPHERAEETELGRLADDEAELTTGDRRAAALFHPERDDAQGLERCGQPGDGRHRALDADVVAAGRAAANADAPTAPREPVVGSALGDGVIQIGRVQHVSLVERLEAFGGQPAAQDVDDPRAERRGLHHAAVEEHVRRAGQPARAAADGAQTRCRRTPGRAGTARGDASRRDRRHRAGRSPAGRRAADAPASRRSATAGKNPSSRV